MKRNAFLAILLAFTVVFSGCIPSSAGRDDQLVQQMTQPDASKTDQPVMQDVHTPGELRLAYDSADTMNPYTVHSQINQQIMPLLFDPLVKLNKQFEPAPYLANSVTIEDLVCTVSLKPGILFSDGSPLTSEDVLYSISLAMTSGSIYSKLLANVASYTASDEQTVVIQLKNPDVYFQNMLTFPVIKNLTGEESFPVGTGRFMPVTSGDVDTLVTNPRHFQPVDVINTIRLTHLPDTSSLNYALKTGDIDYIFSDLAIAEQFTVNVSSSPVQLNNLVYLGINSYRGQMSDPKFRQAIASLINGDEIAKTPYLSKASPAFTPFHPDFYAAKNAKDEQGVGEPLFNYAKASALLDELGFDQRDEEGYRLTSKGRMKLTLIVNMENQYRQSAVDLIRQQMADAGIELTVEALMFDEYKKRLAANNYDLYLAEVRLTENMDIESMLYPNGVLGFGVSDNSALLESYRNFRAGTATLSEFYTAFVESMPFVPILYRQGIVTFNHDFYADIVATEQDIFYNIDSWSETRFS